MQMRMQYNAKQELNVNTISNDEIRVDKIWLLTLPESRRIDCLYLVGTDINKTQRRLYSLKVRRIKGLQVVKINLLYSIPKDSNCYFQITHRK